MVAIYRIYNTETGKSYIGQSKRPYRRITTHLTPGSSGGSSAIQAALLNHPPESWQWEIIADDKDYPGVSIDDLECWFINQYDSRVHGYNIMPGGKGASYGDTRDETWFSRGMRDKIVNAIANYQRQHQRQQEIISEYGSLKAYTEHLRKQYEIRRHQAPKEGCLSVIGFFSVILIFISLITSGC